VRHAERAGTVRSTADRLALTDAGRRYAQDAMVD
jgi:hypothetical protein